MVAASAFLFSETIALIAFTAGTAAAVTAMIARATGFAANAADRAITPVVRAPTAAVMSGKAASRAPPVKIAAQIMSCVLLRSIASPRVVMPPPSPDSKDVSPRTESSNKSPNKPLLIVLKSSFQVSPRLLIAPSSVFARFSIAPAKSTSPIERRYCVISAAFLPMFVLTPRKVNVTRSPSAFALIPNSFSRSNSPVAASAIASIRSLRLLPIALAVLP